MSCDIDGYDDVNDGRYQCARKEHCCIACGEQIRRGDRYHYQFIVYDGRARGYKHCLRCWQMIQRIDAAQTATGADHVGVDLWLMCGHKWSDVMGSEPPLEVQALAFLTADEAQERLPGAP